MKYLRNRWAHQIEAEARAWQQYQHFGPGFGYALFFEPGTGKTGTAINIIRRIMNHEKRLQRILIFCPAVVVSNWKNEFRLWSAIDQRLVTLLDGSWQRNVARLEAMGFAPSGAPLPRIFVTNYEKIVASHKFQSLFLAWKPEILICDESHRLKAQPKQSQRARLVDQIANPIAPKHKPPVPRPSVLLLSGTPILNSALDIFYQFLVLDGGATFGNNFYTFRARYFRDLNKRMPGHRYFPKWVPKDNAVAEIQGLIAAKSMLAKKSECLDLPPLIAQQIEVDMTVEQARAYDEMRRQLITYVKDKACVAQMAVTKAIRLMQIASGFVKTDTDEEFDFEQNPKITALAELFEEITPSNKIIVWAVFKRNYAAIRALCKKMAIKHVELHGGVPDKRIPEAEFRTDPKCKIMIGHPGAGGIGINLVEASTSIWYSRGFSREHEDQANARNERAGSEIHKTLFRYDLLCRGTIEKTILEVLSQKREISVALLESIL